MRDGTAVIISLVLLAAVAFAVLLPWGRLPGRDGRSAEYSQQGPDFAPFRDTAAHAGVAIEVSLAADGTQLAWSVPVRPASPPAA